MIYEIEIQDKLFNDIKLFCKLNNMNIDKYLISKIQEQFFIDKYGDLNVLKNSNVNEKDKKIDSIKKEEKKIEQKIEEEKFDEIENIIDIDKKDISNHNRRKLKSK